MRWRPTFAAGLFAAFALWGASTHTNLGVLAYPDETEHPELSALPPDGDEKTEWAFARLRYLSSAGWYGRGYFSWGIDAPKSDRQFVLGVRRLTRVQARSVEEVVSPDNDELYKWPWIYAVEVGHWDISEAQGKRLREYLLRGGFLMTDDFHGTQEWAVFAEGMRKIFPDRPIVDIPNDDPIFHVLYDLGQKVQVPGYHVVRSGVTYEHGGVDPKWRGVYDDKGRIMVAICHNQDNGDAWEWADSPTYPEKLASQAYRMGINYVVYAMSH